MNAEDALVQAALDGDRARLGTGPFDVHGKVGTFDGTPLTAAIASDHLALVEHLLDEGASLEFTNKKGWTPLHVAARWARGPIVRLLLARGAKVDACDPRDDTPLHKVGLSKDPNAVKVVKLLLDAGANPRARNALGEYPSACGGNDGVRELLKKELRKKKRTPVGIDPALERAKRALQSDDERRLDALCRSLPKVMASPESRFTHKPQSLTWFVGRTFKRAFAHLDREKGIFAFRSHQDFPPYNGYQQGGQNWRGQPIANLDWEAVPALIAESHRLAQMKDGGATTATKPAAILKGAHDAASEADRPSVIHLGGPTPVVPAWGTLDLTLWMAELALSVAEKSDAETIRDVLALVKGIRAEAKRGASAQTEKLLHDAATGTPEDSQSLAIARHSAGAAAALCRGKHDRVWLDGKAAAVRTVKLLDRTPNPPLSVRAFLEELDARILVEEMKAAAAKRAQPVDVERVLWRAPDERGTVTFFLARAGGARYAFLGKLGNKWELVVGTHEDALATVPEIHLEAAAKAAPRDA